MKKLKAEEVMNVVLNKGYKFFLGEENPNLIGIRGEGKKVGKWDDVFLLIYEHNGELVIHQYDEFTTDPGIYYMKEKLLNPKGCAILAPGQYRGMWTFGSHRGKYPALVQTSPVKVYRDRTKDLTMDLNKESLWEGMWGINLHHGYDAKEVNLASAGCQVFRHDEDLWEVLDILKSSYKQWGDRFTYTLLEEKDFV